VPDDSKPQKFPLMFYRTLMGSEPVREWLKGLNETERQAIGMDLLRAQWRWPVGMPLCRPIGKWLMGDPYGSLDETDGARPGLREPRVFDRVARFHKENPGNGG
jgi:hypothetical protein